MVRILWFKETTRWSAGKLISPLQQGICNGAACAVSGDGGVSGTIRIDGDQLVFEIHGIDEILSIKRSISVPLEHVQSVSTGDPGWAFLRQVKAGGANLPGVVKDGRFLSSDGYMFFEMHDPGRCITVSLDHESYKKIVFEVEDKEATAKMIEDALARRK